MGCEGLELHIRLRPLVDPIDRNLRFIFGIGSDIYSILNRIRMDLGWFKGIFPLKRICQWCVQFTVSKKCLAYPNFLLDFSRIGKKLVIAMEKFLSRLPSKTVIEITIQTRTR